MFKLDPTLDVYQDFVVRYRQAGAEMRRKMCAEDYYEQSGWNIERACQLFKDAADVALDKVLCDMAQAHPNRKKDN